MHSRCHIFIFLFTCSSVLYPLTPVAAVWPKPQSITNGSSVVLISPKLRFTTDFFPIPSDVQESMDRTRSALCKLSMNYLSVQGGSEFDMTEAAWISELRIILGGGTNSTITSIADQVVRDHYSPADESYKLCVGEDGESTLTINSSLGMLRGLTTFEQLFYALPATSFTPGADFIPLKRYHPDGSRIMQEQAIFEEDNPRETSQPLTPVAYSPFAPYEIEDYPQFYWRGLMIDTSRHWFPVHLLQHMIDAMSFCKLNKFHWHITDSQSWPLGLEAYPELAEYGSYSSKEVYSEADVSRLVDYAAKRGIDVILEIDVPGHSASIGSSHPEYVACMYEEPWRKFAVEPPAGQLRYMLDDVQEFIKGIFSAIKPRLKSNYLSTGGDELDFACYDNDPVSMTLLTAKNMSAQSELQRFIPKLHASLNSSHPVVWEESLLRYHINLTSDAVVIAWINTSEAHQITDKGHYLIHVPSDYFYLDCGQGSWLPVVGGLTSWCRFNSWEHMYSFNPYTKISLEKAHLVLGGETAIWTEQTDQTNIESKVWPRAAAAAEVFWTANGTDESDYPMDPTLALERLQEFRYRMVGKGFQAAPLQPHWCAIRPGACS